MCRSMSCKWHLDFGILWDNLELDTGAQPQEKNGFTGTWVGHLTAVGPSSGLINNIHPSFSLH